MMKSLICIALALVLLPLLSVTEGGLLGGWKAIKDVSNPDVVEIAKYAIDEHNKQSKTNLMFEKVVQGKEKVVSGKMYDLIIAAKSGSGGSKNYEAVVWDKPFVHSRNLESFKAV